MNEPQGELDYLFREARQFRRSDYFRKMIEFSARMVHLKPFNAMLVYNQMPGAQYVLYAEEWAKRFHRLIKPDARPLVILNFKPVGYVFDLSNTYPDPKFHSESRNKSMSDAELLFEIEKEFDAEFLRDITVDMEQLYQNLNKNGIAVNDALDSGAGYGGHCQSLPDAYPQEITFTRNIKLLWKLPLLVSISKNASKAECINTITHELGHIFCHHLQCPKNWRDDRQNEEKYPYAWEKRILSYDAEEIEAESVAYLVCSRLGIKTKSKEYIASFIEDSEEIPDEVNYEHIFKAANKTLEFFDYMNYKDGMLYKYDSALRRTLDNITHSPEGKSRL